LRAGNFIEPACAVNGLNPATFYRWLKEGEDRYDPDTGACVYRAPKAKREFRKAVESAQSQPEVLLVNRTYRDAIGAPVTCGADIVVVCPCGCGHRFAVKCENTLHVDADQRAREFLLSRKFPDRWGNRERIEHSAPGGGPIAHTVKTVRFGGRYRQDGKLSVPADPAADAATPRKPDA
jgi:hypothetical protein